MLEDGTNRASRRRHNCAPRLPRQPVWVTPDQGANARWGTGRESGHTSQAGAGGSDGRQGCTQHRGLRFCSIRVFTAAFQASGDSIHPLGIRLDCSPPRPHARACKAVQRCSQRTESFRALHVAVIAQRARRSPSLCAAAGTRCTRSVGPTGVRFIPHDDLPHLSTIVLVSNQRKKFPSLFFHFYPTLSF
jgi:hypothetical protein